MKKISLCISFLICSYATIAQNNDRLILGKKIALQQLEQALNDSTAFNVIDNKIALLRDTATVVKIAEAILFKVYKKENIIRQRPYEIYHDKNYWMITGTLPKNTWGGTFYIAIDDRNGKIIRLLHGR